MPSRQGEQRRRAFWCLLHATSLALPASAYNDCFQDEPNWDNGSGKNCAHYASQNWCAGGGFTPGKEWTGGAQFNWPERACCACGRVQAPTPAPTVEEATPSELLNEVPNEVRSFAQARLDKCDASAKYRPPGEKSLLYFARMPRSGNEFMCQLLRMCSKTVAPRVTCESATMLSGAASAVARPQGMCGATKLGLTFYGNDKLSSNNHGACAGMNGTTDACSSSGGDIGAACIRMRSFALPAAVLMQTPTFPQLFEAPCLMPQALPAPSIKLITLLRDPGERAQSAYMFGLNTCVCNFRYQWCTQFTSFRFRQRVPFLCDGHKPKSSFAQALQVVRSHGHNVPWPTATVEAAHVLGRYTSSMVKNVYTNWFGSYRAASGATATNAKLARITLSRCFAWVGIAEEMDLSLQLLKRELPHLFHNLEPSTFATVWQPRWSANNDPLAANQSKHPYLRSHLLVDDYEVYDAERRRLHDRARRVAVGSGLGAPPTPVRFASG